MIETKLNGLLTLFEDNTEKVNEIVSIFINETPLIFEKVEQLVRGGHLAEAAELIHKVKIRYGYFGLDTVLEEFTAWENHLKTESFIDHVKMIQHFKKINNLVIGELKKSNSTGNPPLTLKGKNILVAEDDDVNAMVFELFIKETGATVIIAKDGGEAIRYTIEKKPDLIFMDVHMPVFSGLEVIREVRGKNITCPIVSLSASTRLNERQSSLDAGANDFLIKPVNRGAVVNTLMKFLG
jgi:CheY-like chemotaxis protein